MEFTRPQLREVAVLISRTTMDGTCIHCVIGSSWICVSVSIQSSKRTSLYLHTVLTYLYFQACLVWSFQVCSELFALNSFKQTNIKGSFVTCIINPLHIQSSQIGYALLPARQIGMVSEKNILITIIQETIFSNTQLALSCKKSQELIKSDGY